MKGRPENFVEARLLQDALGTVVVEGPSKEDVEKRELLSDRAGEGLRELFASAGERLASFNIIPAVACMRPRTELEPEMRKAVASCAPLFWAQLPSSPGSVLLIGKWAHAQWTGVEKAIGTVRGFYAEGFERNPPLRLGNRKKAAP